MGVFIMTSSKIGPFCDDVIKKKGKKTLFVCVFVDDVISVHIYVLCKDSAPILEKFLGLKKTQTLTAIFSLPF